MTADKKDIAFMQLALAEARKGIGYTSPNPCVGAVIVKDGNIIATGYHQKAGTPHAEVHALLQAGGHAVGATLYVTLEPCCHTGATPPCSHAVVKSGIARVVIGMLDPNPLVNGGGMDYLRKHGVLVTAPVLPEDCRSINEPFIKFITTGRPLIILKAGVSLDGRLNYMTGKSGWITGSQSLERAHHLRSRYDAILVGSRTIAVDNPLLSTRLENGTGRDALRIILDSQLGISPSARILNFDSSASTWIFCRQNHNADTLKKLEEKGAKVFAVDSDENGRLDLEKVVERLAKQKVTSILVEGGGTIHASFLRKHLVDKVCLFYAPLFAGTGGVSLVSGLNVTDKDNAIRLAGVQYTRVGDDMMVTGDVVYPQ